MTTKLKFEVRCSLPPQAQTQQYKSIYAVLQSSDELMCVEGANKVGLHNKRAFWLDESKKTVINFDKCKTCKWGLRLILGQCSYKHIFAEHI